MSTRWISVFGLAASLFVLWPSAQSVRLKSNAAQSKVGIDFCCLAGLSCCYIPPGSGGQKAQPTALVIRPGKEFTSINGPTRQVQTAPTGTD